MTRLQRLAREEKGMTYVFVGVGFLAFLSASMLAIDVGMLMTARSQAQNSADAGALAGAVALLFDDFDDHSDDGPAVTSALAAARANNVMAGQVSVMPDDVEFLPDGNGTINRVRVTVYRRADRGNPLSTFIATYFGRPTADIAAIATAEASPANAQTCVKPFIIPDRWTEVHTPQWDPDDEYSNGDIYIGPDQPGYTGYDPERDKGLQLVIKAGTGNNIAPSFYYPLAIPGGTGAAYYRWNIENCNQTIMPIFSEPDPEPGNMVGPTRQGVEALIDKDPTAYWDDSEQRVVSSYHPSPRIGIIPVFDPDFYYTGKQNGRNADLKVTNFVGVFFEGMQGGDVIGRIVPVSGLIDGDAGPAPAGAFPKVIRLIQ
jgi:hypothetical protein